MRNVHERMLAERELRFRATHDDLTSLPGRAAIEQELDHALDGTRDERRGRLVAVAFCDVDEFKSINDDIGHHAGDVVLTEVATRLRSVLRATDFVGRFGGDEFVVIVTEVDDEDHAERLAARIHEGTRGPLRLEDGTEVEIGISMGVAVGAVGDTTTVSMMRRADLAMYESKRGGRDRSTMYSPAIGAPDHESLDATRDVSPADAIDIAEAVGALELHYGPVVPLRDGLVSGASALGRWRSPEHGLIPLTRLIDDARSAGRLDVVVDRLMSLAVADLVGWSDTSGFVAIDVGAGSSAPVGFAGSLLELLSSGPARACADRLVLRMDETTFADDESLGGDLARLRSLGVRVFLDEVGVGSSSLSDLRRLPVDGLRMAADVIGPAIDEELVRITVAIAETLSLVTIVDGVENTDQLAVVRRLGVDYAESPLFGRPTARSATPTQRSET